MAEKNQEMPQTGTQRIDGLLWSISEQTIRNTEERYDAICSSSTSDQLKIEVQKCFPENKHKVIREFFISHPVCWTDMLRKIFALKKYDNEKKIWYIGEEDYREIYASFLIRWRKSDIWSKIRMLLPDSIVGNQDLLNFAWAQPSLLDEGWYMFSKVATKNRKWHILKLITTAMIRNIDKCNYHAVDIHLPVIFPKILRYVKQLFWKTIHLDYCKDIHRLVNALDKMFASGHGDQRENAFRIIQAFHAWSSIEDIEKYHALALEKISLLPKKLIELWVNIDGEISSIEHNDATIYIASIIYKSKKYRLESRVKTVQSILQKLWETEEYTNKDAVRDTIWMNIIWPDGTRAEDISDIMIQFWGLMPDFWYLFNDKWLLEVSDITHISTKLSEKRKNPAYISKKRSIITHSLFRNASFSGYIDLGWVALGAEIQFSNESWAEWKKNDDMLYKPKWMLVVLMRGTSFSIPKECYDLLNERIRPARLRQLGFKSINDMILAYIQEKEFLIPYTSQDWKDVLFTLKSKEDIFIKKFPSMIECKKDSAIYQNMVRYIQSLI